MTELISPENGAVISVMTDAQKEFVRRHRAGELSGGDDPFLRIADGDDKEASAPATTVFSWRCDDPLNVMTVEFSRTEDFSEPAVDLNPGPVRQSGETGEYFTCVNNFRVGEKYFWRVRCGDEVSPARSFSTPDGEMRLIDVRDVPNFRDIGGRRTLSGRRIKQGMIFRGTFIDYRGERCGLSARGRDTFVNRLGIRTEIDLRIEALGRHKTSPAGDGVRYEFIPMENGFGGTFNERGMSELRKIFDVLFDESSYPVYFHCHSGADRTGFLGIVLDGLLGLPDDEIKLGYNITSLFEHRNWDESEEIGEYFGFLHEQYPGHNLSELVRIHMTEYGLDREKLEKMTEFLLEG